MRITQVHISNHVKFFAKQFCELWGLREYDNVNDPALFLGCYDHREIEIIKAHRGFKLVMPTGEGSVFPFTAEDNVKLIDPGNLITGKDEFKRLPVIHVPLKDYRTFKPVPLGDKIYCYQGRGTDGCKKKYNYSLLKELMQELGEDKFIIGYQGHSMEDVIEKFYKPSFINLQLNAGAGFTSTLEMAHMGRWSICNVAAPFCYSYKNIEDIIKHIKYDRVTVGIFVNEFLNYDATEFLNYSDNWLNTEYWQ